MPVALGGPPCGQADYHAVMNLFQFLNASGLAVRADECKVHLAVYNGHDNPLDLFLAGEFDSWQEGQTKRNFQRPHVVSLIALPGRNRWLFGGVFDSDGAEHIASRNLYVYQLVRRVEVDEFVGRLVVAFERTSRQSYLRAENWVDEMQIAEVRPDPMRVIEFPGYASATLSKQHLDIVVAQAEPTWRGALANVAGIYVIADRSTGKLYVGSATGKGGLWARWSSYSRSGHGGNKELKALLRERGAEHAEQFQFGILEIADTHASTEDVVHRECHWKDLLVTREHGLNAN